MKKYLIILSVFILSSTSYAQDWLKIANDGYKEYKNKNYCFASEYFIKVKSSNTDEAKTAIEIWGEEDFNQLHQISLRICFLERMNSVDKSLIEYAMNWNSKNKTKMLSDNISRLVKDKKNIESDADFYSNILQRIQKTHEEIISLSKSNKIEDKTLHGKSEKSEVDNLFPNRSKYYYALLSSILFALLLIFIFYKWLVRK